MTDQARPIHEVGSAPRARGTRQTRARRRTGTRISPACAGNTSSPNSLSAASARISPACAGNTCWHRSCSRPGTDQPRVRGEHEITRFRIAPHTGSAPRARGTRATGQRQRRVRRISPACAGNTQPPASPATTYPDQPRVRGEHIACRASSSASSGSAPRARGTLGVLRGWQGADRISPACAGNTRGCLIEAAHRADQPRVRGEHLPGYSPVGGATGSAPRARGTRPQPPTVSLERRISPACAGNTTRST